MVRDPVCGMTIEEADAAATSRHEGRTIYFCAISCKQKFDAAPEKYLNGDRQSSLPLLQIGPAGAAMPASAATVPAVPSGGSAAKIDIGVQGMHCASCVSTIEGALAGVAGVKRAVVNLAAERGTVTFDPAIVHPAALVKAIADTGYSPLVEKVTIPISGISCASCVATIEGALRETPGVVSASVNLATHAATVEFVPAAASLQDLRRAIRGCSPIPIRQAWSFEAR